MNNSLFNILVRLNKVLWIIVQFISICVFSYAVFFLLFLIEEEMAKLSPTLIVIGLLLPLLYITSISTLFYLFGYGFKFYIVEK